MAQREARLLAIVATAYFAFDPAAGLTAASDISHLSEDDLERGEQLFANATEADIAAALAATEADIEVASVRRPS
jgi:hypothetical protein